MWLIWLLEGTRTDFIVGTIIDSSEVEWADASNVSWELIWERSSARTTVLREGR